MSAVKRLMEFATQMTSDFSEALTLTEAIRQLALSGDASFFSPLPPLLLNDGILPSVQRLDISTDGPGYRPGFPLLDGIGDLIGGCILDISESRSSPVLIFYDRELYSITVLVCQSPLSLLESTFFKSASAPSKLEAFFKGTELSNAHSRILEMIYEHSVSLGPSALHPSMLSLDANAYHLIRKGPVPLLHLRDCNSKLEIESLCKNMKHYLNSSTSRTCFSINPEPDFSKSHTFKTVFAKDYAATATTAAGPAAGPAATSTTATMSETDELVSKIANSNALSMCIACILASETNKVAFQFSNSEPSSSSCVETSKQEKQDESPITYILLSNLLSLSARLFDVFPICSGNHHSMQSEHRLLKSLCNSMFESPLDAELVSSHLFETISASTSQQLPTGRALLVLIGRCLNANDSALLVVDMNASRQIKSIRIVNSQIEADIDSDCAGRFLEYPWIFPICALTGSEKSTSYFALKSATLFRTPLVPSEDLNTSLTPRILRCEEAIAELMKTSTSGEFKVLPVSSTIAAGAAGAVGAAGASSSSSSSVASSSSKPDKASTDIASLINVKDQWLNSDMRAEEDPKVDIENGAKKRQKKVV